MSHSTRPVIITNPLVPHTHSAQSMKPYGGETPSYVTTMDEYAKRAGLAMRHLLKRRSPKYGDELMLVYSGTREQISHCVLIAQPSAIRWPTAKATLFESIRISPKLGERFGNIHKLADTLYAISITIDLPRISKPYEGVECFDFHFVGWGPIAYHGTRAALIAAGIGDPDMFPDDGSDVRITKPNARGYELTLEESLRLHDGHWAYLKYPHIAKEIEEDKQKEAEKKLCDYKTPEEWLEHKEDWICNVVGVMLSRAFCSVDTKFGMRFTVDAAALESIKNEIEAAAQRIRNIPVKVQSLAFKHKPGDLGKAAAAAVDGKFRSFMQSIVGRTR